MEAFAEAMADGLQAVTGVESHHNDVTALVTKLLAVSATDLDARDACAKDVNSFGADAISQSASANRLLKEPLARLMTDMGDQGTVPGSLMKLQEQVSRINPNAVSFNMSGLRRLLALIPGVGTPMSRWFSRYQTAEGVINDIVRQLKDGKVELQRDNLTLAADQRRMREAAQALTKYVAMGQAVDQQLTTELSRLSEGDERRELIEQEYLFALRQRIMDLQQQLAVNQQGVLTAELIMRNNGELIRGVDRCLNVTVNALQIAATQAVAFSRQKTVLDSITATNQTTNVLIQQTAENLRVQGVAIHNTASSMQLDINALKSAFTTIEAALTDVATFRKAALPKLSSEISSLNEITGRMAKATARMDAGRRISHSSSAYLPPDMSSGTHSGSESDSSHACTGGGGHDSGSSCGSDSGGSSGSSCSSD